MGSARSQTEPARLARKTRFLQAALVAAVVFAAFWTALSADFLHWDDDSNFLDQDRWRGLTLDHLQWMATTFHNGHYQPLSWLTLGIDHALWGMDPHGYHLTNVVLHALGAVAFYFLALELLPACAPALSGRKLGWAAVFAALLFGVHPLRVESVAWITERRDVLSGLFFTLSILAYVRFASGKTGDERKFRRRSFAFALVCMLLSLLAKAWGIVIPGVLILLDRWPLRRPIRTSLLEKIPFVLLAIPFAWLAFHAQAVQPQTMRTLGEHGPLSRLAQAAYATVFYPLKTLAPISLSPIYDLPEFLDPLQPRFLVPAVIAVAATLLFFWKRRSMPAVWTAWAAFLVIVAPVTGIAQSGPQLVADRYSYLACMPFALLAAGFLFGRVESASPVVPRAVSVGAILLIGALGIQTSRQALLWRDTETLFRSALEVDPKSSTAHDVVAGMLLLRGRIDEAEAHCRAAIANAPSATLPHTNRGLILLQKGRLDEAVAEFREVLRLRPDFPRGGVNLAVVLFRQGKMAEAEAQLREAALRTPRDPVVFVTLGGVLLAEDRAPDAVNAFETALAVGPESADAHEGLSNAYAKVGRADLAAEHARRARTLRAP